jgi:hypothetical protein
VVYASVERLVNGHVRVFFSGFRKGSPAEDKHGVLTSKSSQTTVFHA